MEGDVPLVQTRHELTAEAGRRRQRHRQDRHTGGNDGEPRLH